MLAIHTINKRLHERSRLTALKRIDKKNALFACSCGNEKVINISAAIGGNTLSCGCLQQQIMRGNSYNKKYTFTSRHHYSQWRNMIERCYNKRSNKYKFYGGRGVRVCELWRTNYQAFIDWSLSTGWKDGMHLDKDIKGNGLLYSPSNCCWVTALENINCKRNTLFFNYNGRKTSLADICRMEGVPRSRIYYRYSKHPNYSITKLLNL